MRGAHSEADGRIATRWAPVAVAVLIALGVAAAPAAARDPSAQGEAPLSPAAGCAGPRDGSISAPGDHRFSQSFSPRVGGALTTAELDVTKPPGSVGNWVIEIHLAVRIPIGTVQQQPIASTTIADSTVPAGPSTITARFADPPIIFSGVAPRQEYELVVTRPDSSDLTVGYRGGNECPGVLSTSASRVSAFNPVLDGDADLVFEARVVDATAPTTRIARGPRKRTSRHRATFKLRATEPVSGFRCRVDRRRMRPCGSTKRVRIGRGPHALRARAIDLAGNADPTPAKRRWRVTR